MEEEDEREQRVQRVHRARSVQSRLDGMEEDIRALAALKMVAAREPRIEVRDQPWRCENCGNLLGWYNDDKDVMRIRYKQHLVFMCIGVGGWVQSICVTCSEPNVLKYEEEVGGD